MERFSLWPLRASIPIQCSWPDQARQPVGSGALHPYMTWIAQLERLRLRMGHQWRERLADSVLCSLAFAHLQLPERGLRVCQRGSDLQTTRMALTSRWDH